MEFLRPKIKSVRTIRLLAPLLLASTMLSDHLRAGGDDTLRLDLDTAVRVGAANYFALQALRNREAVTAELITERWRAYLPGVGVSYNRNRDINKAAADSINHEIRINIEQVIYDGGRRSLDLDIAKVEKLLAREDFRVTYNKLRLDIQKAYFKVLAARTKLLLNAKSLERARVQLRDARREESQGFSTRVQVLTVASRLREIELALTRSIHEHRQALYDLKLLLNLDVKANVQTVGDIFGDFVLRPPSVPLQPLIESALVNRPEVNRSVTNVHKLRKEKQLAEDSWIPRVSIDGYAGRNGPRFPVRDESWGVNLRLTFPIGSTTSNSSTGFAQSQTDNRQSGTTSTEMRFFDDLSYDRRVLESKIALGEGLAEHRQLPNRLSIEVQRAFDLLQEAWESIRIGNGRVYFQFESLRLTHARYRVGDTRRSDILFQETELVRAQTELTDAIAAYMTSAYELEYTAGRNPGDLNLFIENPGGGNTLLPYLLQDDFKRFQQRVEKLDKTDPLWQIDDLDKDRKTDTKTQEYLIDQVKP